MLPEITALVRRDLRLHQASFALPGLVALLCSLSMLYVQEHPMSLIVLSLWVALLIPHAIHLREEHHGTLAELGALPIGTGDLLTCRWLEGIMAAGIVVFIHSIVLVGAQGFGALRPIPWTSPGWLWMLLLFLAVPMPITLRWGGRGWIALVTGSFAIFGLLVLLNSGEKPMPGGSWLFTTTVSTVEWFSLHPHLHRLALLVLCLASLPLAAWAHRHRDV